MSKPQPKKRSKETSNEQKEQVVVQKAKRWSTRDINKIDPITDNQRKFFNGYRAGKNVLALGSPGVGKSYISVYLAMMDVLDKSNPLDHFKIVRSAVETRPVGFLKGTLEEKVAEYEIPFIDIMTSLTNNKNAYELMKETGIISFTPTTIVRGLTWDNTVVLIDEVQNMTWHEINSVVTRLGVNSKLIVAGDFKQGDLNERKEKSGIGIMLEVIEGMKEFEVVNFTKDDCVRSGFVKAWLHRCEDLGLL